VATSFGRYDHRQANGTQNYLQLSVIRTLICRIIDSKFKAADEY